MVIVVLPVMVVAESTNKAPPHDYIAARRRYEMVDKGSQIWADSIIAQGTGMRS